MSDTRPGRPSSTDDFQTARAIDAGRTAHEGIAAAILEGPNAAAPRDETIDAIPDMNTHSAQDVADPRTAFMAAGGDLGAMMRAHPWAGTTLGAAEHWPLSLKTTLQIVLSSRFAMWMAWGPELTFFCNDAYRPTLGTKTDWLGARSDKVWEEIWPDIGPRIDRVLRTGDATWDEGLLLFLERSGFPEETYHTFSYSPLADDAGATYGMLCVVTEETNRIIGDRRLHVLRDLALRVTGARTVVDVWRAVEDCLASEGKDLSFCVAYRFDDDGRAASLAAACGVAPGSVAAPHRLASDAPGVWPVFPLRNGVPGVEIDDLGALPGLPSAPWDRAATRAIILPIAAQGQGEPLGAFVAGLNPYRPLDADYRAFVELFVGQIAAALANVNAYEAERQRAEALAEVDRAKTAFFSNISHEFRTPLTLMIGPLDDALDEARDDPKQFERLTTAHRNSLRLLRLVNALLDFSRIESGRMQATYRPVDLARLTNELASSFQSATTRAGLALVIDCPPLPDRVFIDRDMWEMIVLNLLSNAFKFTFEGRIVVGVRETDGQALLTVADTGTGISHHELPRIFERFHRVEGASGRSFEGSGIGLALVQELVHLHGGTIRAESEPGRGTTFTVAIPLGTAHLPADRIVGEAEGGRASSRSQSFVAEALRWLPGEAGSGVHADEELPIERPLDPDAPRHRVLLADDNADLRGYIARLLVERGYQVETAVDGFATLDVLRQRKPDLLVTDVMMPGLDGFGVLSVIREDPRLRDLPVIMLSARAGEEAQIEGFEAGADDYLIKPFSARELLARVAATLKLSRLRRESAAAIQASEARSAAVLEGMTEACVLVDPAFRVVQFNRETLRLDIGFASDAVGRTLWDAWPELEHSEQGALLRAAQQERTPAELDVHRAKSGGSDMWFEMRAYPSGPGLAIFCRDVTDRKRAERALQNLNETLEQQVAQRTRERDRTWNNSQDLLLVADARGIMHAVNPAWTTILGYRDRELLGRSFLELVHPEDREGSLAAVDRASHQALPVYENRYRHKDGSFRWISWVASPEGERIYASGRHVTAEKQAAAELEAAQAQLRQSQKMEAVGQLTGGLAHDFNNLLTGISGSLELLQSRVSRGQVTELDRYVAAAQGAAKRAAALTHRLLAFSRRQTLDPRPISVNRLIADMEELIRRTVGPTIAVEVVGASGLWTTRIDANQLENALLNLCINARDAMPDGGRLTIETANRWLDDRAATERDLPAGQYLSLCVTDSGTGMSPEVVQRAFDPFFTTKPIGVGTGLGLSMVYGFARQSGGQVRVYSEIGRGTTMCIYLPRHFGEAESDERPQAAALPAALVEGETVLVVDDEATVRMLITEVLEEFGYHAIEAVDGAEGLRVLQSEARIDLLITDVGLPGGMNGRQVADAGRVLRPGLKVLFITGYAENAVIGNGHLEPGMQVLTKPFAIEALSRRIRELMSD